MKKILLLGLVLVAGLSSVFAATDYYIKNYDVQITVGNNAVHHIVETLDVYFEGPHHGIVREIPVDYRDYNKKTYARISGLKCSDDYEAETDNGYYVMQIGSASRTLIGDVQYVISYDYDLGADFNEDYDEFYMNIIGPNWECPIRNVRFSVVVPFVPNSGFSDESAFLASIKSSKNTHLTSGRYGSTSSANSSITSFTQDTDGSVIIKGVASGLSAYHAVTLRIDLPDGWYKDARAPWDYRPVMRIAGLAVSIVLALLAVLIWMRHGRDETPIIVARFEAPKGFSPLLVGYVADSNVDDKDIISMLFYWADEGLLSIEEKKANKYEFTKLKDIEQYAIESGKDIPELEVKLFNGFFKNCEVGGVIKFKDLEKNNFYQTIIDTKFRTKRYFTKERSLTDKKSKSLSMGFSFLSFVPMLMYTLSIGLYEGADIPVFFHLAAGFAMFFVNLIAIDSLFSKWYMRKSNTFAAVIRVIPTVIGAALLYFFELMLNDTCNVPFMLVYIICSVATGLFGVLMLRRSAYGNSVLEQILGYREFIDKVEIDKLKMMIQSDPDLYYRVLSYAVVLGLEDKWAKKFDGMIINPPTWFTGYSAFDYYYLTRMASRMTTAIPMASVPRSSISGSPGSRIGGSSFHSSGFSGGGFGGGGGHAW